MKWVSVYRPTFDMPSSFRNSYINPARNSKLSYKVHSHYVRSCVCLHLVRVFRFTQNKNWKTLHDEGLSAATDGDALVQFHRWTEFMSCSGLYTVEWWQSGEIRKQAYDWVYNLLLRVYTKWNHFLIECMPPNNNTSVKCKFQLFKPSDKWDKELVRSIMRLTLRGYVPSCYNT